MVIMVWSLSIRPTQRLNVHEARLNPLKQGTIGEGPVVYWMSRDQRVQDNWALVFSQTKALEQKAALLVVFCLTPVFLGATLRHYAFMLRGLEEIAQKLKRANIPFFLLQGRPDEVLPAFIKSHQASLLISDFSPLKIKKAWNSSLVSHIAIPYYEVDAHNVVPCWHASPKQEYGAYTLRPKIKKLLPEFMEAFPKLKKHPYLYDRKPPGIPWNRLLSKLQIDRTVRDVKKTVPGENAALKAMHDFIAARLERYPEGSRDPNLDTLSGLSPYLHFGHLSAQRVAGEIQGAEVGTEAKEAFLEELIIRRELADNYCFYNKHYDSLEGFPEWARRSLNAHRKDKREHIYTLEEFESALTHDELWNAAQREMVIRGKMHSYMRMYWAKKILEWTESPDSAQEICIYLNDRYELDGRDPNGYTGIAWSIGGVHDRAWKERPIFGKIRYMSYNGCARKFDIKSYMARNAVRHADRK
jgi:deoxyribodipyrimidine photo-lyase